MLNKEKYYNLFPKIASPGIILEKLNSSDFKNLTTNSKIHKCYIGYRSTKNSEKNEKTKLNFSKFTKFMDKLQKKKSEKFDFSQKIEEKNKENVSNSNYNFLRKKSYSQTEIHLNGKEKNEELSEKKKFDHLRRLHNYKNQQKQIENKGKSSDNRIKNVSDIYKLINLEKTINLYGNASLIKNCIYHQKSKENLKKKFYKSLYDIIRNEKSCDKIQKQNSILIEDKEKIPNNNSDKNSKKNNLYNLIKIKKISESNSNLIFQEVVKDIKICQKQFKNSCDLDFSVKESDNILKNEKNAKKNPKNKDFDNILKIEKSTKNFITKEINNSLKIERNILRFSKKLDQFEKKKKITINDKNENLKEWDINEQMDYYDLNYFINNKKKFL